MKRILISLTLIVIMLAVFSLPVAASETDDVKAALAKIQAQFPDSPQVAKLVSDANTWLATNGDTLPEGSGAIVAEQIDIAISTAGSAANINDLTEEARNSILNNISLAAAAVDLSFTINISGGVYSFTLNDNEGSTISTAANDPIKQTGFNTKTIIFIIIGVTALFGVAIALALITGKKRQPSAV